MSEQSPSIADSPSRLAASRAAYAALRPGVEAGEPWPLAPDFGTGPEASWGPREVLSHVAEMLPYWLGELERVVQGGGGPGAGTPFGRTAEDVLRLGILERDRTLPLRELFDRIDAGIVRWERRLADATERDLRAVGLHPRLGELTGDAIRDRFVVDHLEDHITQLEGALASR